MKIKIINSLILALGLGLGHAQGFVNLNFEQGITTSNTIPGWIAYRGGISDQCWFNNIPLDSSAVTLQGTNSSHLAPIEGKYSVWLFGASRLGFPPYDAELGQTAQIPITAASLTYWGNSDNTLTITFAGQLLSFAPIGSAANHTVFGADISAYAGQVGELLFTAQRTDAGVIDNILFSSSPVPEPSQLALAALGTLLLGFRRWKK